MDDRTSISTESGNRENDAHRIALCITELDVGGAERFLVELATRLNRNLFQPTVYCLGPRPRGAGAELVARLSAADVPVRFFDARGIGDVFRILRQLRNEFIRQRPALVQTFLWHANVLGTLAARGLVSPADDRRRVPIITGLRVAEPRRRWRWPIERWAGRWADRHVAVSEGVARFARERIGLAADKIVVIPEWRGCRAISRAGHRSAVAGRAARPTILAVRRAVGQAGSKRGIAVDRICADAAQ